MAKSPNWSKDEINLLERSSNLTDKELNLLLPHRTVDSIEQKRRKLNIKRPTVDWTVEELQILQDNYLKLEDTQLADLLPNRSSQAINLKRFALGLMKNSKWTDEDNKILKENYYKGLKVCLELLPHHPKESILTHANDLGLKVNMHTVCKKLYHNDRYFSELTLQNCYWAGFIAADGCLPSNTNSLVIALSQEDKEHLELFKQHIEFNGNIRLDEYKTKSAESGIAKRATISLHGCHQIKSDLEAYFNITSAKTKILTPPNLTEMKYKLAYIAGYTDGDGSIFRSSKNNLLHYSVVGNLCLMEFIKNTFDELIPVSIEGRKNCGSLVTLNQDKYLYPISRYILTGERAVFVLQEIKKLDLPLLKRKWDKIE